MFQECSVQCFLYVQVFLCIPNRVLFFCLQRVVIYRILPALTSEFVNPDMVPFVLPNVLLIAEECTKEEYVRLVLPDLTPVFKQQEPVQVHTHTLLMQIWFEFFPTDSVNLSGPVLNGSLGVCSFSPADLQWLLHFCVNHYVQICNYFLSFMLSGQQYGEWGLKICLCGSLFHHNICIMTSSYFYLWYFVALLFPQFPLIF